jgi:hypothetical protein
MVQIIFCIVCEINLGTDGVTDKTSLICMHYMSEDQRSFQYDFFVLGLEKIVFIYLFTQK